MEKVRRKLSGWRADDLKSAAPLAVLQTIPVYIFLAGWTSSTILSIRSGSSRGFAWNHLQKAGKTAGGGSWQACWQWLVYFCSLGCLALPHPVNPYAYIRKCGPYHRGPQSVWPNLDLVSLCFGEEVFGLLHRSSGSALSGTSWMGSQGLVVLIDFFRSWTRSDGRIHGN